MPPAISVCIPVYATERSLPACLQSVAAQRGLEAVADGMWPRRR
ncbi:MAG: glycosyltransferase [Spirochaetaceae bacterium]|nr:glycosyltransferase [Spirochaetaceae bacterium]